MNDIKKAIEYFEVSKNCIPKNETKEYRTLFIEVADTALKALQLMQKQEQGLVIELPCKPSDMYFHRNYHDYGKLELNIELHGVNEDCLDELRKTIREIEDSAFWE